MPESQGSIAVKCPANRGSTNQQADFWVHVVGRLAGTDKKKVHELGGVLLAISAVYFVRV